MATDKPRVTITFPHNLHATIHRLAELQGRSFASVVVEFLETIHDPLMRTVALIDAARSAPGEVREGLRNVIEDMEREMVGAAGSGIAQMDWLMEKFRAGGASQPPQGNTGVRSSKVTKKQRVRRAS